MRLENVRVQQRGPLTSAQIPTVYALAEKIGVSICLHGNCTPRDAVFTWNTEGSLIRIVKFIRALKQAGMR